ncbi:SMP-30/gluconolactonase/LRE family protein [Nocardia arthritidis]|nr:SMP-30/gluconolactonase/LRE family protein [Nocardia arthritidis]
MRLMPSTLGVLVLAAVLSGCGGGDKNDAGDLKPGVIKGFSNPESVLVAGDKYVVSNMGAQQDPVAKDGDGFLSLLDATGKVIEQKAMPKAGDPPLNSPKGMAFVDNKVYVADVDRVVGYDLNTRGQVFEAKIDGDAPTELNDIVLLDNKTLLVTDTLRSSVYQLDLDGKKFATLTSGVPGANGIALEKSGKIAYVNGDGAHNEGGDLFRLELGKAPLSPKKIGGVHGLLDGIAVLSDGNIAVSDWVSFDNPVPGKVTVYKADGTEVAKVKLPDNVRGPADFTLDKSGKYLLIPAMTDNVVHIVPTP